MRKLLLLTVGICIAAPGYSVADYNVSDGKAMRGSIKGGGPTRRARGPVTTPETPTTEPKMIPEVKQSDFSGLSDDSLNISQSRRSRTPENSSSNMNQNYNTGETQNESFLTPRGNSFSQDESFRTVNTFSQNGGYEPQNDSLDFGDIDPIGKAHDDNRNNSFILEDYFNQPENVDTTWKDAYQRNPNNMYADTKIYNPRLDQTITSEISDKIDRNFKAINQSMDMALRGLNQRLDQIEGTLFNLEQSITKAQKSYSFSYPTYKMQPNYPLAIEYQNADGNLSRSNNPIKTQPKDQRWNKLFSDENQKKRSINGTRDDGEVSYSRYSKGYQNDDNNLFMINKPIKKQTMNQGWNTQASGNSQKKSSTDNFYPRYSKQQNYEKQSYLNNPVFFEEGNLYNLYQSKKTKKKPKSTKQSTQYWKS